ncbi:uncharacterized protein LOC134529236 [Bacillus rossius redtenbacheri]|uniref:uncharacterized protein LOC134529236 n=1 Tax=Bacillus rossius redtenbacheri TaxID=93214 RepID=UPI002FDE3C0C
MKVFVATLLLATVAAHVASALPARQGDARSPVLEAQELERARRSPADGDSKQGRGGVRVDVREEDRVGVVAEVRGHGTVWRSDDGRSRVDARGEWSKVLDGPQWGKPRHGAGISFSHDFGDD